MKKQTIGLIGAIVVVGGLLTGGCVVGLAAFKSSSEPDSRPSATAEATAGPKRTVTAVGINEGDYRVPEDVKPGTYKAKVPAGSFGCYWERASKDDGSAESIILNGFSNPGASVTVVIKPTDKFFKTNGCGVFMKVK